MATHSGLGPVFAAECVTTARRWQVYAGRTLLIASVLAVMTLIWVTEYPGERLTTIQQNATVGSALVNAIMAVELVLAIAIVPAAAAGAICQDKMRGGLTLIMVTDLSDAEIVLGKLASRLVTILGIVACGLPVLAILTSLGGVDPQACPPANHDRNFRPNCGADAGGAYRRHGWSLPRSALMECARP